VSVVTRSSDLDSPREDRRVAFERLAMPHARALHRTAQRLAGSVEDASDVVQDTFLRAYRTFDSFRAGTNEKAWLFTILYSIVSNRWQASRRAGGSRHRRPRWSLRGPRARDVGEWGTGAAPAAGATPEILKALDALPEPCRAAVLLIDVEELTYEEASTALACPVGTVRSRLACGRRLLCAALTEYAVRTRVVRGPSS